MKPARRIITALMACLIALTCHAEIILDQDVNRDGNVDVQDLTTIINLLLKGSNSSNGDVNHDGVIDVRDITCTLNAIITGKHTTYRTEYDYVWDYNDLPEVHIEVSVDQWNQLLAYFDENFFTKEYVMAKITFMSQNG
ncbi:MAG: dockerin type I repeat-containing protein, partial [Muribaculaceae bacterium]|nr:dockerin type I repeat-containing protein [Muribaculaceae bacterium]